MLCVEKAEDVLEYLYVGRGVFKIWFGSKPERGTRTISLQFVCSQGTAYPRCGLSDFCPPSYEDVIFRKLCESSVRWNKAPTRAIFNEKQENEVNVGPALNMEQNVLSSHSLKYPLDFLN